MWGAIKGFLVNVKRPVKKQVRQNQSTIYGGRAMNESLPIHLRTITTDYDIFSSNPRRSARQLERKLDRQAGGDCFVVRQAQHRGTWKVVRKNDNKGIADFTKPKERFGSIRNDGVSYTDLDYEEKKRKQMLRDKKAKYRHDKARDDLTRIRLAKQMRGDF